MPDGSKLYQQNLWLRNGNEHHPSGTMHLKSSTAVRTRGCLRMLWTCSDHISNSNQWPSPAQKPTAKPESLTFGRDVWIRVRQKTRRALRWRGKRDGSWTSTLNVQVPCQACGYWSYPTSCGVSYTSSMNLGKWMMGLAWECNQVAPALSASVPESIRSNFLFSPRTSPFRR